MLYVITFLCGVLVGSAFAIPIVGMMILEIIFKTGTKNEKENEDKETIE